MLKKIARTIYESRTQEHPAKYIASRALVKTGLCSRMVLRRNGYQLRFHPSNVSVSMWLGGADSFARDECFIRDILRSGDTFIDVGANIGHLTLVGKLKVDAGRVVAIEAHPRTYSFLTANIHLNGLAVEAVNVAVGEKRGTLFFSDLHADDCNGISVTEQGIPVPVQTLDELLESVGDIRLLKIDIEGYELFAFRGARDVLRRTQFVYFELWDQLTRRYGYQPRDILQFLQGAGFRVYRIDADSQRREVCDEDFSQLENYLAVRS